MTPRPCVTRFVSKRLLCVVWMVAAMVANAAVPSVEPVTKVVGQYALTSANDFPQRDPFDWRLLASTDGGKTWVTLDVRRGEIFPERHQRRVFALTSRIPYNLYRFQIDRVRDPASADAVQLSEIELMGMSASDISPRPIFSDLVTAKGANPPVEAPTKVFDGLVETKWLDRATSDATNRSSWIQWQYRDTAGLVVTNIEQLLSLREKAEIACPVKINGVVVGSVPGNGEFFVLDATGFVSVRGATNAVSLRPGRRVLVEGVSQWLDVKVTMVSRSIAAADAAEAREPRHIEMGEPFPVELDYEWVEVDGEVRFVTQPDGHCKFELWNAGGSASVMVLGADSRGDLPAVGTHVRAQGVGVGLMDADGKRVLGNLWVTSVVERPAWEQPMNGVGQHVRTIRPTTVGTNAEVLTAIEQISQLSMEALLKMRPRVRVRGVVTEMLGTYVQQGSKGMEALAFDGIPLPGQTFGAFVEIEGKAVWANRRGPVISAEKLTVLGRGKMPEPARPSWGQLASGSMEGTWIEVDAVVRATDGSHLLLDYEGRQMMATIRAAAFPRVKQVVDASVRLRGVCINATDARGIVQGIQLVVPSFEFVEVKLPAATIEAIPARDINSLYQLGSLIDFSHRVKVRGVLTFRDGRRCFLQDKTGGLMAVAKTDVTLAEITRGSRWVFWQSLENEDPLAGLEGMQLGDEVEVVGFPQTRGYAPVLTEAIISKAGVAASIAATNATPGELALGGLDSTVVSLKGLVLGREIFGRRLVLQIQSGENIFQASMRIAAGDVSEPEPGSRVQLTGVCQMSPDFHGELGKSPAAFNLLLRTPADIVVLQSPPWWTPRRTLTVAGGLLVVLFAAILWIRLLHRQVEDRTRMLKQEITEHEMTELRLAEETKLLQREIEEHRRTESDLAEKTGLLEREIEERKRVEAEVEKVHKKLLSASRLAGMADVATNVLHNVGNVLNSVNVLSASITTQVQRSKMPGVARLAELLGRHRERLASFVTEDENGKHVPAHLERLGARLEEEHAGLLEKAKALNESVQHAKEIVAMQQNYAKVAGVLETVSLAELVEDALRMCTGALARHEIEIERDFQATPTVTLDRHKVLQILFNLLDNAKHACESPNCKDGKVTVRTRSAGLDRVRVQVADNGIGISAAHRERIFTQGFSTRKGGHGFGLHSSILAAQDMGGSLTVESAGPGMGATFTLEIPVAPENTAAPMALRQPMLK